MSSGAAQLEHTAILRHVPQEAQIEHVEYRIMSVPMVGAHFVGGGGARRWCIPVLAAIVVVAATIVLYTGAKQHQMLAPPMPTTRNSVPGILANAAFEKVLELAARADGDASSSTFSNGDARMAAAGLAPASSDIVPHCNTTHQMPCMTNAPETQPEASYTGPPDDLIVCMCIFSAMGYTQPFHNTQLVLTWLAAFRMPVLMVELTYPGQQHRFRNVTYANSSNGLTVLHLRADTHMFHKENLWNIALNMSPPRYTKLLFLDSDVVISGGSWPAELSNMLNRYDVVQPYARATWRADRNNVSTSVLKSLQGFVARNRSDVHGPQGHGGFATSVRRDWLQGVGGFYQHCLTGGGDVMFWTPVLGVAYAGTRPMNRLLAQITFPAWASRVVASQPRVSFAPWTIFHFPHGAIKSRGYHYREDMLRDLTEHDLHINGDGVLEFNNLTHSNTLKEYFRSRQEDAQP